MKILNSLKKPEHTETFSLSAYSLFFGVFSVFLLVCISKDVLAQSINKPLTGYRIVVVEKVTVDQNPKTAKFPAGYDAALHRKIIDEFNRKKVFVEVIDAIAKEEEKIPSPTGIPPSNEKKLTLTSSIIEFDPGNKALRYTIGWGAGSTKVKVRFELKDSETGRRLLTTEQRGKFMGFVDVIGPGRNHGVTEASGDVVDGLIREINKNR